ncbi:MAG: hypothetical protein JNM78_09620 [Cyclobacteriaceae bacterium]|nr:hypothetical protein [Cyclobacteriaceae bacterium]
MKNSYLQPNLFLAVVFSALAIGITSCSDTCEQTRQLVYYQPVYSTSAQVKAAVKLEAPKEMSQLGRIYFKDGYLFINEMGEGIHIIDNRIPANPKLLSFLAIPGNYDLAIQGNTLYADSYIDLIAFDISTISAIKEVNRIEGLFNNYMAMGYLVGSTNGILTDWKRVDDVQVYETDCRNTYQPWGGMYYDAGFALTRSSAASFNSKAAFAPTPSSGAGIGGSMARFTLSGNHLYALDGVNLDVVDVTSPTNPKAKKEFSVAWDVETLFPHTDKLFVGSRSGMYILDLAEPENPTLISKYEHVRSCDPVVVEGDYAFVTLRSGSACEGFTNQLEVIDIKELTSPTIVATYAMTNPHGLGIDDGTLFICDGSDGLKAYDATNVKTISQNQLAHFPSIQALDIIPYQNVAMMIGTDGLYQYDYTNIKDIKLLSQLPIVKK